MDTGNDELQEKNANNLGSSERTKVGFPQTTQKKENKSSRILIIFLIVILLLLGGGAWYLFGTGSELTTVENSPTPSAIVEETTTPTPTDTPAIDRSEVSVQILNGTGISGAAGDLEEEFKTLGYEDIKVGNASTQNNTKTTVSYDTNLLEAVKDEITGKLESIYDEVVTESKTQGSYDVIITTGYPKGHKASPTPTEKAKETPTPTKTSGSPTITSTVTVTPTP